MELRPRKGRVSSASETNPSTPYVASVNAKNQQGSSQTIIALPSSRRKPSRVKASSRSTASKSRTCLSFEEEDDQQRENCVYNREDDDQEEKSASLQTFGHTITPQSSIKYDGRLRSLTPNLTSESVQEVNNDTVSFRVAQGCADRDPSASDAIQLDGDLIDVSKGSISKVNSEHRKLTSNRKGALRRDGAAQGLFENDKCGLDEKDTQSTGIQVFHENANEACHTNRNSALETSTTETILIGNGYQKKAKKSHTSLGEAEEIESCSLMHLVADNDVHQEADGREKHWMGHEGTMAKARCVDENDEQAIAEIKQHSCANLQGTVHGGEEPAQGNDNILQQEGFVGTGSESALSAGRSSRKTLKKRATDGRQTSRKISEQKGRNGSSHKVNAQKSNFDSNEILCSMKQFEFGKEEGNAGLASTGENERIPIEASTHCESTKGTDGEKDIYTEEHDIDAEGTSFQGFSGEEKVVRREQDCEELIHTDEDEEEMARMFIESFKARLQQRPAESVMSIQKEMATKVGGCEEEDSGAKKAAVKEERQITSNGSRLSRVGLSWSPETGLQATKRSGSIGRDLKGTIMRVPETIWQKEKKLQDGLLVPPVDPRKLNKLAKKQAKDTAGAKWFDLSAPTITPELKKDLQLLKLRNVIDPKRHYKAENSKGLPKYFQVGTVIGGPADFYSGRLTKKERKSTLADELLSDSTLSAYRKRKYLDIQDQKQAGGKQFWKKKKNQRKPSWARI